MNRTTKALCIALLIAVAGGGHLAADEQFRMALNLTADFAQKPTLSSVQTALDDQNNMFWGPSWEVIIDKFGFGMHYLVKFDRLITDQESVRYDWSLDWMGDFYAAYHVFGGGALIDPFIEVGFGNVGRVDIDDDDGYWVEDAYGDWDYMYEWDPNEEAVSNMSLFPYVGIGVALDLDGLLIGGRIDYRPVVLPIPAAQFRDYPLTSFQVGLFGGFALGGH
jgi:hypothetical protein